MARTTGRRPPQPQAVPAAPPARVTRSRSRTTQQTDSEAESEASASEDASINTGGEEEETGRSKRRSKAAVPAVAARKARKQGLPLAAIRERASNKDRGVAAEEEENDEETPKRSVPSKKASSGRTAKAGTSRVEPRSSRLLNNDEEALASQAKSILETLLRKQDFVLTEGEKDVLILFNERVKALPGPPSSRAARSTSRRLITLLVSLSSLLLARLQSKSQDSQASTEWFTPLYTLHGLLLNILVPSGMSLDETTVNLALNLRMQVALTARERTDLDSALKQDILQQLWTIPKQYQIDEDSDSPEAINQKEHFAATLKTIEKVNVSTQAVQRLRKTYPYDTFLGQFTEFSGLLYQDLTSSADSADSSPTASAASSAYTSPTANKATTSLLEDETASGLPTASSISDTPGEKTFRAQQARARLSAATPRGPLIESEKTRALRASLTRAATAAASPKTPQPFVSGTTPARSQRALDEAELERLRVEAEASRPVYESDASEDGYGVEEALKAEESESDAPPTEDEESQDDQVLANGQGQDGSDDEGGDGDESGYIRDMLIPTQAVVTSTAPKAAQKRTDQQLQASLDAAFIRVRSQLRAGSQASQTSESGASEASEASQSEQAVAPPPRKAQARLRIDRGVIKRDAKPNGNSGRFASLLDRQEDARRIGMDDSQSQEVTPKPVRTQTRQKARKTIGKKVAAPRENSEEDEDEPEDAEEGSRDANERHEERHPQIESMDTDSFPPPEQAGDNYAMDAIFDNPAFDDYPADDEPGDDQEGVDGAESEVSNDANVNGAATGGDEDSEGEEDDEEEEDGEGEEVQNDDARPRSERRQSASRKGKVRTATVRASGPSSSKVKQDLPSQRVPASFPPSKKRQRSPSHSSDEDDEGEEEEPPVTPIHRSARKKQKTRQSASARSRESTRRNGTVDRGENCADAEYSLSDYNSEEDSDRAEEPAWTGAPHLQERQKRAWKDGNARAWLERRQAERAPREARRSPAWTDEDDSDVEPPGAEAVREARDQPRSMSRTVTTPRATPQGPKKPSQRKQYESHQLETRGRPKHARWRSDEDDLFIVLLERHGRNFSRMKELHGEKGTVSRTLAWRDNSGLSDRSEVLQRRCLFKELVHRRWFNPMITRKWCAVHRKGQPYPPPGFPKR